MALFIPSAYASDPPRAGDFSAAEWVIERALARDTPVETASRLTLSRADGLDELRLGELGDLLSGLTLKTTRTTQRRSFAVESAGAELLTLWENRGARDITMGTSLIPGESIIIALDGLLDSLKNPEGAAVSASPDAWVRPRAARERLASLPGVGEALTNPIVRFWGETRDERPVWDMAERMWDLLLLRMSPYSSDDSAPAVDGADPIGHCTTYTLSGDELAAVLSDWVWSLSGDSALLWMTDFLAMDANSGNVYAEWFGALSDSLANASAESLKLRVYLDTNDEVTAITGSTTVSMDKVRLPLSISYRKKTIGNRVDKTLSIKALPSSCEDGFRLSVKESLVVDARGNNKRTISATLDGRMLGESFEAKLASSETNAWSQESGSGQTGSSGSETFKGSGSFTLKARARERMSISWSETGSAWFDVSAPEDTWIERATAFKFQWKDDERASVLADAARAWLEDALSIVDIASPTESGYRASSALLGGIVEGEITSRSRPVDTMPMAAGISTDSTQSFASLAEMDGGELAELTNKLAAGWKTLAALLGIAGD
jgi:hypothetical protein